MLPTCSYPIVCLIEENIFPDLLSGLSPSSHIVATMSLHNYSVFMRQLSCNNNNNNNNRFFDVRTYSKIT